MKDEVLIRKAAAGDQGAFEQLVLTYQKQVYNLCYRMSGNEHDAYDLSQEVFLRVWRALAQYQFEAEFSTWLFRLTSNLCIDFLRKQKRQQHVSLTCSDEDVSDERKEFLVPDLAPNPEEQTLMKETQQELMQAFGRLPLEFREILQLRVVENLPYEQIAQILDIKVGTVKSRLARAREQLRKQMKSGNKSGVTSSNPEKQEVSGQ